MGAKGNLGKGIILLRSFWHFVWEEDSLLSWAVAFVLAFVLIKFIVYPFLGILLGTSYPVVAVVSNSMEHNSDFESWWDRMGKFYEDIDISEDNFREFPLRNGFNRGDIIVLHGRKPENIKTGEVVVFQSLRPDPIIHRVIARGDYFETKGDNNALQIVDSTLNEKRVAKEDIIGVAWFKLPYLGYVKIWFTELLNKIGGL